MSPRAAFFQRWLRISVLALALAIARWLWSRRKKPSLEDGGRRTAITGGGAELFTGIMPSLPADAPPSLTSSRERRILSESERAAIVYKYVTTRLSRASVEECVLLIPGIRLRNRCFVRYDCFLSHKRSDCHDICLRISDNLKFKGVHPFIDREVKSIFHAIALSRRPLHRNPRRLTHAAPTTSHCVCLV
jgi:hypothetical protein